MAMQLVIPLKNMEAEDLNLIRDNLNKINTTVSTP
jgi:hypothetical protein